MRRLWPWHRAPASRSYRYLARLLEREFPGTSGGVCLAVTSPDDDGLSSEVVLMLAYCLQSEFDRKVLVVDARARAGDRGITGQLGLDGQSGLSDILAEQRLPDVWPIRPSAVANVDVLPAGRALPGGAEAGDLGRLAPAIAALRPRYGFLLLQVGGLRADTRNLVCCTHADAVLLVAEERRTLMRVLDDCRTLLADHGVRDVRVVMASARS